MYLAKEFYLHTFGEGFLELFSYFFEQSNKVEYNFKFWKGISAGSLLPTVLLKQRRFWFFWKALYQLKIQHQKLLVILVPKSVAVQLLV